MLKKLNRNKLVLNDPMNPIETRLSYVKDIVENSTFFPKTVKYRDIDETYVKWVEEELKLVFESVELPTYALFSNQRYSEYMQMWESLDDNNNLKMNFKVITRENNPQTGKIYDGSGVIPAERKYLLKRIEALNDQGKLCYVDYKMSQPTPADLNYKLTIVTNKYELLNEFNMLVQEKFKSLHTYIFPNGHSMCLKLKSISDESDYTVDDRQYFAQTYEMTLMAYVLSDEDFEIEVKPIVYLHNINGETIRKKPQVEIEDFEVFSTCPEKEENRYYKQPTRITINFDKCDSNECSFTMDSNMVFEKIEMTNVRTYSMYCNDIQFKIGDVIEVHEGDVIKIKIKRVRRDNSVLITIDGYNPDVIFDKKDDFPESELDAKNFSSEIEIQ